jgi:uncharacterized protein (DUF1778 family)
MPVARRLQVPSKCRTVGHMATRTRRIEMRADEASVALISRAAELCGQSVSAFVLGAATREAYRVLGRAGQTLMPAFEFDALVAALDEPDLAPRLQRAAADPRRLRRV